MSNQNGRYHLVKLHLIDEGKETYLFDQKTGQGFDLTHGTPTAPLQDTTFLSQCVDGSYQNWFTSEYLRDGGCVADVSSRGLSTSQAEGIITAMDAQKKATSALAREIETVKTTPRPVTGAHLQVSGARLGY